MSARSFGKKMQIFVAVSDEQCRRTIGKIYPTVGEKKNQAACLFHFSRVLLLALNFFIDSCYFF